MTGQGSRAGRVALFAVGAVLLCGGQVLADACDSENWASQPLYDKIPDCELQVQQQVYFPKSYTSGWAFYCTGDHPYFWGYQYSFWPSYTFDNSCFTVTENIFYEDVGKFDATITNWCIKPENIVVTLACSSKPQPQL